METFQREVLCLRRRIIPILLSFFLLVCCIQQVSAAEEGGKVTLKMKNANITEAFSALKHESGYDVFYDESIVRGVKNVDLNLKDVSLREALAHISEITNLKFEIVNHTIVVGRSKEVNKKNKVSKLPSKSQKITGRVVDDKGEPLIGANVSVVGTSNGSVTDMNGEYSISAGDNDMLSVSYLGYIAQKVKVGRQQVVNITLQEDNQSLNEVVVIGYGTVKKRDLTGAVASIKSQDITSVPTGNAMEAIEGKVAGLDITRSSGKAGASVNITLRGSRSINGSNTPLFIIDGVEASYSEINPDDIESIEVLKDASSTAIYGSAGANGVVIITTKRGKVGKSTISFDAYVGINGMTAFPKVRTGQDYINSRREAYRTTGVWKDSNDDSKIFSNEEWEAIKNNQWVDWFKEGTRTGIQQSYTVSMNGGTEKTKSYVSINYYDEDGVLKNDDYKRYSLRMNADHKFNNWMKIGISAVGMYSNANARDGQTWTRMLCVSPLGEAYNKDGSVKTFALSGDLSPIADMAKDQYVNNAHTLSFAPNGYVEFTPLKGLSIKSVFGAYLNFERQGIYQGLYSAAGYAEQHSSAQVTNSNVYNYKWENIINYNFNLFHDHEFTLTGVTSWTKNQNEQFYEKGYDLDWDKYVFYNLAATSTNSRVTTSQYVGSQLMSYVFRINYSYKGRYLLTLSNRYDGSSILASGNRWASFPAAAVAWRISDENFMSNIKAISNLKLRIGYGVTGNAGASAYATESFGQAGTNLAFQDNPAPYYVFSSTIANKKLTWEKSYSTNIGVDLGLLNNRFSVTTDVYNTNTKGILFKRYLPASLGDYHGTNYSIWQNICQTNNKGIELLVNSHNIQNKDFVWSTDFTFAANKEKIIALTSDDPIVNGDYYLIKGQPINTFYDYQYAGIWQESESAAAAAVGQKPGLIKIKEKVNDGKYDSNDYQILGHYNPTWTAGLQNNIMYKNFDLSLYLVSRWGMTFKDKILGWYDASGLYDGPKICDYWTPENTGGHFPRPSAGTRFTNYTASSSLFYVNGSYIKVKNITLGYSLPLSVLSKFHMSKARFYATIENPFVYTRSKYLKNYDPERGGDDEYPLSKTCVLGLNIEF